MTSAVAGRSTSCPNCGRHFEKRSRLHAYTRNCGVKTTPVGVGNFGTRKRCAFGLNHWKSTQRSSLKVEAASSSKYEGVFEPRNGLPIVKEYVKYGELLRDIRLGKVKEIHWFTMEDEFEREGPCLVEYVSGTVKQSHVPAVDMRIAQAMNAHGVKGMALRAVPSYDELYPSPPPSEKLLDIVTKVWPIIGLALVYVSAQYMAWKKGDMDDRKKIREKDRETARRQKVEESVETQEGEAESLANMGWDTEEIVEELDQQGIEYDRAYIEKLVARAQGKAQSRDGSGVYNTKEEIKAQMDAREDRRRQSDPESEDSMDQATRLLSLSTLKVRKARKKDENEEKERSRKIKQLSRRMKSKGVKLQYTDDDRVYFDDVAGIGNAKFEVMEVVDFFTSPEKFRKSGARIPRGVLLCGPPGCGKTMLARAVAGEAGANFLSVNASEFVEMFIGVGASRVRDLFQEARKNAPAIVFIDEVDAVGRVRGGAMGNDERDQTVNQLLSELDGFNKNDADVVVMAATNRRDVLDPALIRAGRFDRVTYVGLPDFNGRIEILEVYLNRIPTEDDIDLREIAFETQRFSGASLANLVNIASMLAGRDERDALNHQDLLDALDYERLGPRRQAYSDGRQKRLAVHESATALVSTLMPSIEPVVYITILPREKYPMGQTVLKVNEQRELTQQFTKRYLEEQLLMVLAARAAEELEYGKEEMSSINQRRLVMARRIVQKLMVSGAMDVIPGIGHRTISNPVQHGRTKKQIVMSRVTSKTHEMVDEAMEKRLNEAYGDVMELLQRNRAALTSLIDALMEKNMVSGEEVREIVNRQASSEDLQRRDELVSEFL